MNIPIKTFAFIITLSLSINLFVARAQSSSNVSSGNYIPVQSRSLVQDKNFYLLTLFQQITPVSALLSKDKILLSIRDQALQEINKNITACEKDHTCFVNSFLLKVDDVKKVSERLKILSNEKPFKDLVQQHLRVSGYFQNMSTHTDTELLAAAWEQCASGINNIIEVYGNGKQPLYPTIDSITYALTSKQYKEAVYLWGKEISSSAKESNLFVDAPLNFALTLLEINNRDEAARYEPLQSLENKAACTLIPSIRWEDYPYTAIVILGAVSEVYNSKLPPKGKLNVMLGARNFEKGLAPLIIVSGGHVHPFRTPLCEAIEMKKELMEKYHIPEDRIIIEPHARHTTTNLRNASRLIYQYHIPANKKVLITTNEYHSTYVESKIFTERCQRELGYQPGMIMKRISPSTIEFLPDLKSLHRSPVDPLDP